LKHQTEFTKELSVIIDINMRHICISTGWCELYRMPQSKGRLRSPKWTKN